jgi:AraC family ethanolamine operon transcriptional activator
LLEQRVGQSVHVDELAVAASVSERTLRTAFNEYFRVGPIRYLQLRQLHQIYRALRVADPEAVSVTDVLLQYGVWELGRFACRYHQLFGERPSDTLRRKAR